MVLSSINSSVHYRETRYVDKDDIDTEVPIYQGKLLGCMFDFVLGNVKYKYKVENILYIPVYVIKNNERETNEVDFFCIGVYEFKYDELNSVTDEQGNIILEYLKNFRMFKYVKRDNLICLEESKNDFETDIESEDDKENDDDNNDDSENDDDEVS